MKQVYFITTNPHKYRELEPFAASFGYALKQLTKELDEPQNEDIEMVVRSKALHAYRELSSPSIVDDSGLFVPSLNNFPGTATAYVMRTIGLDGMEKLCRGKDRKAIFITILVYVDKDVMHIGRGEVKGVLDFSRRQNNSSLASDVFIPDGSDECLTKLMATSYQSHRKLAAKALFNELSKGVYCAE